MNHISSIITEQARINSQEWLAIFPEVLRQYILPKIRKTESDIVQLEQCISKLFHRSRGLKDGWFVREVMKAGEIQELLKLKRELSRLKRYLLQPKSAERVDQLRIDRAKEYPILQIAELGIQKIKKCGGAYRCLCPYHSERTPSFYLYPQANSYHCYGCQAHGDVISFTEKVCNLSFVEAVKYLAPIYGS